MKRILLRTFALGGVVLLGLFAIAQAQRNAQDRSASTTVAFNPVRTPDAGAELSADGVRANPLRPADNVPAPVETPPPRYPANEAMPVSAAVDPPTSEGNPLRRSAAEQPLRSGSAADPFGIRERQVDPSVRATSGEAPINAKAAPENLPARQPNVLRGEAQSPPPANPGTVPAESSLLARGDRYSNPPPPTRLDPPKELSPKELPPSQEPARLKADLGPPPASIPRPLALTPTDPPPTQETPLSDGPTGSDGAGQPGGKHLEGPQTPQLSIQKAAPPEIQVGKPAVFRVTVRNIGPVPAGNVEVRDQVPRGTRLMGTKPKATQGPRGDLVWNLGTIPPGEETSIEMQLMPTAEGEIGSVATVHFAADASARTIATRPKLVVETAGTAQVMIGDETALAFTVSNPGTGVATGVVLEEHVPPSLQHPAGAELEYAVGDLKPGESRRVELKFKAAKAGRATNVLAARGDGSLRTEHRFDLEVVAPQLQIGVNGPKRRYLEREASYQVSISNPGTAPAQQVELVAYLPTGMKFVSANNAGQYDEATRAVSWRLEQLPPNVPGTVELVALPIEPGQQSIKIRGTAQKTPMVEKEQPVVIEGIAAVLFQLSVAKNPIEVGGETSYEIHVVNQGSKAATNVRVMALLPPELKPLAAEGPVRHVVNGNQVQFDGLASIAPKADVVYRVRVQGVRPGDLRMRCQLLTDDMQVPVTKEESTRVYADE